MDMDVLVRGFATGFAIAIPIGPIGALCIRRALVDGRLVGWACWTGVATADAFYSAVAAFGLTAVAAVLVDQRVWIRLVGGLLLCFLGLRALGSQPVERPVTAGGGRLGAAYVSTLGLTLANPTTILTFAAIFSGTGALDSEGNQATAAFLVVGVFLGSYAWWLPVGIAVGVIRDRLTPGRMRWLNRLFGVVLVGFGLVTLGTVVQERDIL